AIASVRVGKRAREGERERGVASRLVVVVQARGHRGELEEAKRQQQQHRQRRREARQLFLPKPGVQRRKEGSGWSASGSRKHSNTRKNTKRGEKQNSCR
ncbi:unnamed protein product, partial [Ectocarpus fasciculatus]